jgi:hypothetical protein
MMTTRSTMVRRMTARSLFLAVAATWLSILTPAAERPAVKADDVTAEEFSVASAGAKLTVEIQSPSASRLSARPLLLLNFSTDRKASLREGRYGEPARMFLENGHRVASFDLPAHGERVDRYGSGIAGLCARFSAGEDPFALFVTNGQAVIDECIRRGWAESGRIVVCGVSRAGYCAVRLMAADARIVAVAALAPVTDWRELREFAAVKDRSELATLTLDRFADLLAGRRLFVAIGNSDSRVGTAACVSFVGALCEGERSRGLERSRLRFELVDDSPGHTLAPHWRRQAVQFLLDEATQRETSPLP